MNGVHDLGGMHGFGPVDLHDPALRFEHEWEPAVVAMQSAMERSVTNIDEFRHAIERMDPVHYLGSTYFEHWVESVVTGCLEHGIFDETTLAARERAARDGDLAAAAPGPLRPARDRGAHPFRREAATAPRFVPGDHVATRNVAPAGHTRLARYLRGKPGVVDAYRGCFIFPDTNAHNLGESPQHLYSVRFEAADLWDGDAGEREAIYADLFESYLERVGA
jgi:nitrile hydratase